MAEGSTPSIGGSDCSCSRKPLAPYTALWRGQLKNPMKQMTYTHSTCCIRRPRLSIFTALTSRNSSLNISCTSNWYNKTVKHVTHTQLNPCSWQLEQLLEPCRSFRSHLTLEPRSAAEGVFSCAAHRRIRQAPHAENCCRVCLGCPAAFCSVDLEPEGLALVAMCEALWSKLRQA